MLLLTYTEVKPLASSYISPKLSNHLSYIKGMKHIIYEIFFGQNIIYELYMNSSSKKNHVWIEWWNIVMFLGFGPFIKKSMMFDKEVTISESENADMP